MAISQNIARLRSLLANFEISEVKLFKDMSYQRATLSVSTNKVLTAAESGALVFVTGASGTVALTLPSVSAGLHYRVVLTEHTPTNAITIGAGSDIIFGSINETEVDDEEDGPGSSGNVGFANLIIGTTAIRGDWAEFYSDGTSWYMFGSSANDGTFTTS